MIRAAAQIKPSVAIRSKPGFTRLNASGVNSSSDSSRASPSATGFKIPYGRTASARNANPIAIVVSKQANHRIRASFLLCIMDYGEELLFGLIFEKGEVSAHI